VYFKGQKNICKPAVVMLPQ